MSAPRFEFEATSAVATARCYNFARAMFAKTYNVLYQQRVTHVKTMFKVFRWECLDGLDVVGNGFELDIELATRLARNGNHAIPSYLTLFRFRF